MLPLLFLSQVTNYIRHQKTVVVFWSQRIVFVLIPVEGQWVAKNGLFTVHFHAVVDVVAEFVFEVWIFDGVTVLLLLGQTTITLMLIVVIWI